VDSSVPVAEEDMWQNFLVNAETNMVAMLDNGEGEVRERYLEYLDSMNNFGISTRCVAEVQRQLLLTQDYLSMGETLDMDAENIVEDFIKNLQKEDQGVTWQNCPLRVKRAVDAATDGMLKYLSKYGRGGVTHASAIIPPVQPPSVQPSDTDDEAAKPESRKKRKREENDERNTAAKPKPAETPTKRSERIFARTEKARGEGETPTK
jgi:hypothetical protein